MTENQEKELFTTLGKLVTGVNVIQTDVKEIKITLGEHSRKHADHTKRFDRIESKVDSIAEKVMEHEDRLTALDGGRVR